MKSNVNKYFYLWAFLLSACMASIFIIPKTIDGKGIYKLVGDFNVQQIPFMKYISSAIKSGNILWCWQNELGSSFIGSFSFYNLLTPFTIITYFFKTSSIPYLIGPLCILKLGICGLSSYLYLEKFVKEKKYALLGSLFYTFSGFQITNFIFQFYDVIALFPLLLLALEKVMTEKKRGFLVAMVAISALTNYFSFVGQIVFLIIYWLIKLMTKDFHLDKEKFKIILFETLLGIGIAAFILLPTFYFMIENPRTEIVLKLKDLFVYPFREYLQIYKSLIIAPDIMPLYSLYFSQSWTSTEAYLPFVGQVLTISYLFKRPKNWLSISIMIFVIMMGVPVLNSLFLLLNQTYYSRWFYMPILLFSLASIKTMEEKIDLKFGLLITLGLFILWPFLILDYTHSSEFMMLVTNRISFYIIITITAISFMMISLFYLLKVKNFERKIFISTIIFALLISIFNVYYAHYYYRTSNLQNYNEYINADQFIDLEDKNARVDVLGIAEINITMNLTNPSTRSFSSTVNGSIFEFYKLIKRERDVRSEFSNDDYVLRTFLSNKYLIGKVVKKVTTKNGVIYTEQSKINDLFSYQVIHTDNYYTIYENINYLPLGFTFDKYIKEKDFNKIEFQKLIPTLLKGLVLTEEQAEKYGQYLDPITSQELEKYQQTDFINDVKSRQRESSSEIIFDKNTFRSKINLTKDNLVFYSIPYDLGWKAYIDGEETEIIKVDAGFMAVLGHKGENKIEFKYYPKGLNEGLIISTVSIVIMVAYLTINYRKKK